MSDEIFPSFPGLNPTITKTPQWSTTIKRSASGREVRYAHYSEPIYKFTLSFEVLRAGAEGELEALLDFYNARKGPFESFLFADPTAADVVPDADPVYCRVRFDGDSMDFERFVRRLWQVKKVELVTVK